MDQFRRRRTLSGPLTVGRTASVDPLDSATDVAVYTKPIAILGEMSNESTEISRDLSLDGALETAENPVEFLRENVGRHPYPVPGERTNWIEEVRSWRASCSLSDLSHHQKDLYVQGSNALAPFTDLGVNDFTGFEPGQAKQFVACSEDGYLIGDAILFYLEEEQLKLTGTPIAPNWVEYHVKRGDYDLEYWADGRYWDKDEPHQTFRYQLQGPNAAPVMEEITEGSFPEIPFFEFEALTIAGHDVFALRHSMVAEPGFEIWGAWKHGEAVRDAILSAGEDHGIRELGEKSYKAQGVEKGWIARPVPAIFGEDYREYREWLDADSYEGISSIGGSFRSEDISDYYLDPIELGYERFIDWDREFTGKAALKERASSPERTKVTLAWDDEDVLDLFGSLLREGTPYKYFDLAMPYWSVFHYDEVLSDGDPAGVSKYFGYSYNERSVLSLALVDTALADPGTEVTVVWGEPNGESPNPEVEAHRQKAISATVVERPDPDG